jgi:hypothetical protein
MDVPVCEKMGRLYPRCSESTYNTLPSLRGELSEANSTVEAPLHNRPSTMFVANAPHSTQGERNSYALSTRTALHAR